jgi:hypothetical protein
MRKLDFLGCVDMELLGGFCDADDPPPIKCLEPTHSLQREVSTFRNGLISSFVLLLFPQTFRQGFRTVRVLILSMLSPRC